MQTDSARSDILPFHGWPRTIAVPRRVAMLSNPCRGEGHGRGSNVIATAIFASVLGAFAPTAAFAAGAGDAVSPFAYEFMVFVIAIFVGYYVVWSVTPALHTPLMSVTNAISSVIVVGALLAVGVTLAPSDSSIAKIFGLLALTMASVNIFGGFLVTNRMLSMYKKKDTPPKS